MKRIIPRRALACACAVLFLAAGAAHAVDGVIEINQTSATATGFPVAITIPGSYRLTSNLMAPPGSSAIIVVAPEVEIDLNGFAIMGAGGAGTPGIVGGPPGLTVRDGSISSFGGPGVVLGPESKALHLRVFANGGGGIAGGAICLIEDNRIVGNFGGDGLYADKCKVENNVIESNSGSGLSGSGNVVLYNRIASNGGAGIVAPLGDSMISENTILFNGLEGIFCGPSCTINSNVVKGNNTSAAALGGVVAGPGSNLTGNNSSFNTGTGMSLSPLAGYSNNTMHMNSGAEVTPAAHPTDAFDNICDGAAC